MNKIQLLGLLECVRSDLQTELQADTYCLVNKKDLDPQVVRELVDAVQLIEKELPLIEQVIDLEKAAKFPSDEEGVVIDF